MLEFGTDAWSSLVLEGALCWSEAREGPTVLVVETERERGINASLAPLPSARYTRRRILMSWQLRAIAGPLKGAVYRLRMRANLGRAGDCDIQIINNGVSRRHAKVIASDLGYELIDLGSNNGTFVGEQRVDRHTLQAGDEIRIMRSCFVYEASPIGEDGARTDDEVWAVKVTNGTTLRQTVDHDMPVRGASVVRGETVDDLEVPRPGSPVARILKPERQRIRALRSDGTVYDGDLVGDILLFRELQLRVTRQESVSAVELEILQRFGEAFHQPPDDPSPYANLRRFMRYVCRFPARVRWIEGPVERTAAVDVQDLSVGGARVMWRDHPLHPGVVAWLVIDVATHARTRTVVFPTRVAWTSPGEVGLQFAGMPEWEPTKR